MCYHDYRICFRILQFSCPNPFFRLIDCGLPFYVGAKKQEYVGSFLRDQKKDGGLSNYYWAANLQKVVYWFQSPHTDWCAAEAKSRKSTSLSVLIRMKAPF